MTPPSVLPSEKAKPALVVARASKPRVSGFKLFGLSVITITTSFWT